MQNSSAQTSSANSGSSQDSIPLTTDLIGEAIRNPEQNNELIRLLKAKAEIDNGKAQTQAKIQEELQASTTTQFIRRIRATTVWTSIAGGAAALTGSFHTLPALHLPVSRSALEALSVLVCSTAAGAAAWAAKRIRSAVTQRRTAALSAVTTSASRPAPGPAPELNAAVGQGQERGGDHASAGAS